MAPPPKDFDHINPEMRFSGAARRILEQRLADPPKRLEKIEPGASPTVNQVHKLRVATRRADAALRAFADLLDADKAKKIRKALRGLRRAAGDTRDADVLIEALQEERESLGAGERDAASHLIERLQTQRLEGERRLIEQRDRTPPEKLRKRARKVASKIDDDSELARTPLREAGADRLETLLAKVRESGEADLQELENLHQLRIDAKRLRYAMEVVAPAMPKSASKAALGELKALQDTLGALNDRRTKIDLAQAEIDRLESEQQGAPALVFGLKSLIARWSEETERERRRILDEASLSAPAAERAIASLREPEESLGGFEGDEERSIRSPGANGHARVGLTDWETPADLAHGPHEITDAEAPDPAPRRSLGINVEEPAPEPLGGLRRLAAIDLGTNSIRLIVAEAASNGAYRVLDDEKEVARLGRGLAATRQMSEESMRLAVETLGHMRSIAEGYGVERLDVVGTAVIREAENRETFIERVRDRTGLEVKVITAEQEARLAYKSVAAAFDLRSVDAAIVDIGGGSTEVVRCAGGVVEQVHLLPIGAVRLTEMFGGAEEASGSKYKPMRSRVGDLLREEIGEVATPPRLLIGAGGTFTTLAEMVAHMRQRVASVSTAAKAGVGPDITRAEVKHLLDFIRKTPLEERSSIPGLPSDRADIIVAGLAIGERLMKRLGVNRLRVHDKGIRDGLLLTMIEEMLGATPGADSRRETRRRAVRKFIDRCNFEKRHCAHVADLATQIFDQLTAQLDVAGATWASPHARELLETAGLLYDVGYHINYSKHHLHSYHLIVHSDLAGFSQRELEIVASIARYHRRAEPSLKHEHFAKLSSEDREVVRRLAAILRLAGGLDRTHMRRVNGVRLEVHDASAWFTLEAEADPVVDIWGASRKSSLFRRVFELEPRFSWRPVGATEEAEAEAGV